jgi:hypothetical protein
VGQSFAGPIDSQGRNSKSMGLVKMKSKSSGVHMLP